MSNLIIRWKLQTRLKRMRRKWKLTFKTMDGALMTLSALTGLLRRAIITGTSALQKIKKVHLIEI